MRFAVSLFIPVATAIIVAWWWLGSPVEMPTSPLAEGEKLYCVSYAPFRGLQTPLDPMTHVDPRQIDDDLERLARISDCVRTYSTDLGLDRVPEIAKRRGLKVMLGMWISGNAARNRQEMETAADLVKSHPGTIRSVIVGNEALLRGEIGPDALAGIVRSFKARVNVPVTYADVWEFWLRAREVSDAVDFVTIHILPYWEDFPIPAEQAAAHVDAIRRKVADAFPRKEVLIGEVGWPSAGRMRDRALPSPANQARVLHDILNLASREHFHVNVIEAFDQPWKEFLEGTVGGHWGLLGADTREFKFRWGAAVSNHPQWPLQAAAGLLLALLILAAAALASPSKPGQGAGLPAWGAVALVALVSGSLAGLVIENVPLESLGLGGWIRSLVLAALAAAAPLACAAGLMRQVTIPAFASVLARRADRPSDPLVLGLGLMFAALTVVVLEVALGLVFDPRYRDFPFAPLTAAAVPFLVLAFSAPALGRPRGTAEIVAATVLSGSAVFIVLNEGIDNWQALWLGAILLLVAVTLIRSRAAPGS
jgi:exo-beta-1,3-glucanase (GH17 family)